MRKKWIHAGSYKHETCKWQCISIPTLISGPKWPLFANAIAIYVCVLSMLMQVTTCQWSFVIQLLEFHNPMNMETNEDSDVIRYCCCDNGSSCAPESMFYMNINTCAEWCDIFFLLSLSDENSELYSLSTIKGTVMDSPPQSLYGYIFLFAFDHIPKLVRCI